VESTDANRERKGKTMKKGKMGRRLCRILLPFAFLLCGSLLQIPGAFAGEEVEFLGEIRAEIVDPVDSVINSSGDVFILDRKLAKVLVFSQDGKMKRGFGEQGTQLKQFHVPGALALTLEGDVIVADTGNNRLQVFSPKGDFLYDMGSGGKAHGEYRQITSVAVDPLGYIYVADGKNRSITRYTPKGVFLETMDLNYSPDDLAFDKLQNLYVLSRREGKIVKYPPKKGKPEELSLKNSLTNYLTDTAGIAVDFRGDIYLIEWKNNSIVKIDQMEQVLFSFGSQGVGKGQFNMPQSISCDMDGNVFVADTLNSRVQFFKITGSTKQALKAIPFILPVLDYDTSIYSGKMIADLNAIPGRGLYALSDYSAQILFVGETKLVFGKTEEEAYKLKNPQALYVNHEGRMLVADTGHYRLQFMRPDGTFDYQFGKKGKDRSEFLALSGVAMDEAGYIFVADSKNNRIQVFNNDGIYLETFGKESGEIYAYGPQPGTFSEPKDLAFNSRQELYVLDYKNKRIQVFDHKGLFLKEIGGAKDKIKFHDPVDIALDDSDYLYVADRGDHSVKIFDPVNQLVIQFGSIGKGRSYFPSLSSVTCAEGKVYVSDYEVDEVKVFTFDPTVSQEEERIYFTRVSKPLNMQNASEEIKEAMARKLTIEQTKKELAEKLNVSAEEVDAALKVEAEKSIENGQLQITMSIPVKMVPAGMDITDKK